MGNKVIHLPPADGMNPPSVRSLRRAGVNVANKEEVIGAFEERLGYKLKMMYRED